MFLLSQKFDAAQNKLLESLDWHQMKIDIFFISTMKFPPSEKFYSDTAFSLSLSLYVCECVFLSLSLTSYPLFGFPVSFLLSFSYSHFLSFLFTHHSIFLTRSLTSPFFFFLLLNSKNFFYCENFISTLSPLFLHLSCFLLCCKQASNCDKACFLLFLDVDVC